MISEIVLPSPHETGKLKIKQLKRFWHAALLNRNNNGGAVLQDEWQLNKILLGALSLGLEQTIIRVYQNTSSFEDFENWIIKTAGMPYHDTVERFNRIFDAEQAETETLDPVLSADDLAFFETNGYVIIKSAIPKEDCRETIDVICNFLGIEQNQWDTWYRPNPAWQGIMVQLFQHPIMTKNRSSDKIRRAYEQLWGERNIWMNNDRAGFNPPETEECNFPGPDFLGDCSVELPFLCGLRGFLYLRDTAANQGAFKLVPGFQHRIANWLNSLPPGVDPRQQDLHALGSKPITGEAGDFIIWQQALQHGSSPNTSTQPRFVQYINYQPVEYKEQADWR
jgi:hypothetical protein